MNQIKGKIASQNLEYAYNSKYDCNLSDGWVVLLDYGQMCQKLFSAFYYTFFHNAPRN
jgi:hypothetical protein